MDQVVLPASCPRSHRGLNCKDYSVRLMEKARRPTLARGMLGPENSCLGMMAFACNMMSLIRTLCLSACSGQILRADTQGNKAYRKK